MSAVTAWHGSVEELPPITVAPRHVMNTLEWSRAWESVRTERVTAVRYLTVEADGLRDVVPFYLVEHSPIWACYELDAEVDPVWPGPVVYAPGLYCEYGGRGGALASHTAATVDRAIALAREWGAAAVVFTNLTPDLTASWRAVRPPSVDMLFDRAYELPVSGTLAATLAAIPRKTAGELRRRRRRAADRGLTARVLTGEEMIAHLPRFTELAVEAALKHGPNLYGMDILEPLAQLDSSLLLLAEEGDSIAGGFYSFLYGERLYLWTAGLDYRRMRSHHTYAFLVHESMRYAVERGARVLDAGRGNFTFKERHGFRGADLHTFVYLTDDDRALRSALMSALRQMDKGLRAFMDARTKS